MIRIDEIYNHTFWPWIKKNRAGKRLFYCDPFGHTDPQHLYNHGRDYDETGYIFCHDQEPIQLESHRSLFEAVWDRNFDLTAGGKNLDGTVIVSEQGENVEKLCESYSWKSVYYFFHGWACLVSRIQSYFSFPTSCTPNPTASKNLYESKSYNRRRAGSSRVVYLSCYASGLTKQSYHGTSCVPG